MDGFNVAKQLQIESPWAYNILTQVRVSAQCIGDQSTWTQSTPKGFPILNLDPYTNELYQIRFNNDDRAALDMEQNQVLDFYAALKEWIRLVRHEKNEVWIKLKPGRAVMINNWRVMHGRAAFTGFRRVCGSYHGWDDYKSRFRIICKKQ